MADTSWITPTLVRAFWKRLMDDYDTELVRKQDSSFMSLIARSLGLIGVLDKDAFMSRFTTTIGHKIYTPFELGVPGEGGRHSLVAQVIIGAHEHQHVEQSNRDGPVEFSWKYLLDASARALYEAEAYLTSMELNWFIFGKRPKSKLYADKLKSYGCDATDVELARRRLESGRITLKYGGVSTELGKKSIEILKELKE